MKDFDLRKYLAENRLLKEEVDISKISKLGDYNETEDSYKYKDHFVQKYIDGGKTIYAVFKDRGEKTDSYGSPDFESSDLKKVEDFLTENKLLKEELRDVEDILIKAGFRFDDGLLGGVGSGGAGYYDFTNDKIYGYNQSGPWNEEEFSKFYDNFSFNSNLYDEEEMEDFGIDTNIIYNELGNGIYAVGDMGYVEIRGDDEVEIYATPQLADEEGREMLPAFKMDASGRAIPQYSKDEMRKLLKDDMYYIL